MWCCVGTGMENHGKYGDMIYAHTDKDLYVNLFVPSTLTWKEKALTVNQTNTFPYKESTDIKLSLKKAAKFGIHFRYPSWVKPGTLKVLVNGKEEAVKNISEGYIALNRKWKNGDVVTLVLPMETSAEQLPDKSQFVSFVHGPIVLAAATGTADMEGLQADGSRMGHIAHGPLYPMNDAPLIVSNSTDLAPLVKETNNDNLTFSVSDITYQDKYKNLKLVPFYTLHDTRYVIYWPYTTPGGLEKMQAETKAKEEKALELDRITVDKVTAGEQQPENDHGYKFERSETGIYKDLHYRNARGWFTYDLKNTAAAAKKLRVMYTYSKNTNFDLYVNNVLVATVNPKDAKEGQFTEEDYVLPAALQNARVLQVKFAAKEKSRTANVYDVRLVK
jgi:hypothetical protein